MRAVVVLPVILTLLTLPAAAAAILEAPEPFTLTERMPRGPIHIDSDDDFCGNIVMSGVRNCDTADGSAERPYVISGWEIASSPTLDLPAITITHTTKHVIVRSNDLRTASDVALTTLVLRDVENVRLSGNTVRAGLSPAAQLADVRGASALTDNVFRPGVEGLDDVTLVSMREVAGAASAPFSFARNVIGDAAASDANRHGADLVSMVDATRVRLDDNAYHRANGTGLALTRVSHVDATGESFDTVFRGVTVLQSQYLTFTDVVMDRVHDGFLVTNTTTLAVSSSSISDNWPCDPSCLPALGNGIMVASSTVDVTGGTTITGFDSGLYVDAPVVRSDDGDCDDASDQDDCAWAVLVNSTEFTGNRVGVTAVNGSYVRIRESNIAGNTDYGVFNDFTGMVHAATNWWGDPRGPSTQQHETDGDAVIGRVLYGSPASEPYDI